MSPAAAVDLRQDEGQEPRLVVLPRQHLPSLAQAWEIERMSSGPEAAAPLTDTQSSHPVFVGIDSDDRAADRWVDREAREATAANSAVEAVIGANWR